MKMKHNKGFLKGFMAGILACVLVIAVLAMAGCLGTSASSSQSTSETSSGSDAQASETESGSASAVQQDIDVTEDMDEVEQKLETIQSLINKNFMSDETVSNEDMEEGIYKGFVSGLNETYSCYYTKEEYDQLMESTNGSYTGIGVVVTQNADTGIITVVRVFDGSPAQDAGIQKDDVLYKVKGEEVTGEDLNKVVSQIKSGEAGTTVDVEMFRPSDGKYYDYTVERADIDIPMVEYKMLDNNIGYCQIYEFDETTAEQFDAAVDDLSSQGMQGLVIDLRDNPGGLVTAATDVLDRILSKDKLLVYTVDKDGNKDEIKSEDDETIDVPIAVLINENSASASEITCGCLQDYGAATLVGTTSYGKGIVQYVIPLSDGSAVKLTAAKYYTPNGRNIHGVGIDPDVYINEDGSTTKTESGASESSSSSESSSASESSSSSESSSASQSSSSSESSSSSDSSSSQEEDFQLEKAEEVIAEKIGK